jgi:hypothetical protein
MGLLDAEGMFEWRRLRLAPCRPPVDSSLANSAQPRYLGQMRDAKARALPSPLPPTEAELAAWNALTRDEQIARYREYLSHPDCERISDATMDDVLAQARARVAARQRG